MAAFQPTEDHRRQVSILSGLMLPHDQIATVLGIAKGTLYRYFRAELDRGLATTNMRIAESLVAQAVGRAAQYDETGRLIREELKPDRSVSIFLGKARLGLKDTVYVEADIRELLDLGKLDDQELDVLERIFAKAAKAGATGAEPPGGDQGGEGSAKGERAHRSPAPRARPKPRRRKGAVQ